MIVAASIIGLAIVISAVAFSFFGYLGKRAQLKADTARAQLKSADRWIDNN